MKTFYLNLLQFTERLKIMNNNMLENLSKETLRLINLQKETFTEVLKIQNFLNADAAQQEKTIGVDNVMILYNK
jgi:hypothetical protein